MEQEFDSINSLPQDVEDFFHSNEPRLAVERACFLYNIDDKKIGDVAEIVGDVFYGDIKLNEIPLMIARDFVISQEIAYGISYELLQKIFLNFSEFFVDAKILQNQWVVMKKAPLVSEEKAWKRVLEIEPWILEEQKENDIKKKKEDAENSLKFDHLSFGQALEKYPKVNEQIITTDFIRLENYPEPVRPSIRNWVKVFQNELGAKKHNPIERGGFLFQNANTKTLTSAERQKLSTVLKSLDEQTPLTIDIVNESIVFDGEQQSTNQLTANSISIGNSFAQKRGASNEEPEDIFERAHIIHKPLTRISSQTKIGGENVFVPKQNNFAGGISKISYANDENKNDEPEVGSEERNVNFAPSVATEKQTVQSNANEKRGAVVLKDIAFSGGLVKEPDNSKFNEKTGVEESQRKEAFFSIPSSKPPIGSDEYHVENLAKKPYANASLNAMLNSNFNRGMERTSSLDSNASNFKVPADLPVSEKVKPAVKILEKKIEKNQAPNASQDPELMTDEMLFKMYQQKKLVQNSAASADGQNSGAVSFSSSQKFSQKKPVNPYHISASSHFDGESENSIQSLKNIVNLRG